MCEYMYICMSAYMYILYVGYVCVCMNITERIYLCMCIVCKYIFIYVLIHVYTYD